MVLRYIPRCMWKLQYSHECLKSSLMKITLIQVYSFVNIYQYFLKFLTLPIVLHVSNSNTLLLVFKTGRGPLFCLVSEKSRRSFSAGERYNSLREFTWIEPTGKISSAEIKAWFLYSKKIMCAVVGSNPITLVLSKKWCSESGRL